MTITANAKDSGWFLWSTIVSLVFVFFILLYEGASDRRARLKAEAEAMPNQADGQPTAEKAAARATATAEDNSCSLRRTFQTRRPRSLATIGG